MRNRDILGEYYAKSSVNVEINKQYARNIAIAVETSPNPCSYWMSPTSAGDNNTQNVIMSVKIPLKRPYWNPAIQIPEEYADQALDNIDNIAMFVGNKVFYFSREEARNFNRQNNNGYTLFYLPGVFYEKSFVFKNWVNYYGDINLGVKALTSFFLYPARFAFSWFFLILLLLLNKKSIAKFYSRALQNNKLLPGIILGLIIIAGFVLRWNGYTRHSGWTDEIYSAVSAGNPNLSFINTFDDSGNPPFYFIALRYWFKIFGWTENAGTMFSVVLGTGAIVVLYLLVKQFIGKKAALCAAFFTAVSGFAIGYSQEMRVYILKMFLVPLVALSFLNLLKNMSVKNAILYLLPSLCIVNSHYYGILFIMANYLFYIFFSIYRRAWNGKKFAAFTVVNVIIAVSFLPFFLYMLLYRQYNFTREFVPTIGHSFLFGVIIVFAVSAIVFKKTIINKIKDAGTQKPEQLLFTVYCLIIPAFIFTLSYVISFFKPMITFRYLWPINAPFFFALAGILVVFVSSYKNNKKLKLAAPALIYMFAVGLNGIIPDIPSGGTEGYKEARSYIAADAAAHPNLKSVMLEDTRQNAAYYGFEALPAYSDNERYDVLYVLNNIFHMHEIEMYENMRRKNIGADDLLKVYFDYDYPRADGGMVFKKYNRDKEL
ncbi:MAG: glycosyltransferase family 39 protein [Endomicrobium sp.]|nr:glycosyltransferase family 39 protein [Endomicrobium sp.]